MEPIHAKQSWLLFYKTLCKRQRMHKIAIRWLSGPFVIDWCYRPGTQKSSSQPVHVCWRMWKNLHYVWQPNLGTVAIRTFCHWLILSPWNLEELRPACACCLKLFMVYASSHPMWLPQGQITVSVQTGNYCSNNHKLLVPTHIYTHLCHILFMRGTCFLSLLLIYLCSILRVTLLTILLNPVRNIL